MDSHPTPDKNQSRAFPLWPLVAAAVTLLVYLTALGNGFINWDDGAFVYSNPFIRSIDLETLRWAFTSINVANWHPLTMLSFVADYAVWGLNPLGYHLTNIIIHAINTFISGLLAATLVRAALTGRTDGVERKAAAAGFITALLFGIHPLHVESVAWISERKDLLCGLFYMLAMLAYMKYAIAEASKATRWYIITLLMFVLGLMSKPMIVSLPAVLLILDLYPLDRFTSKTPAAVKRALLDKAPFFLLSAASALSTIAFQATHGAMVSGEAYPLALRVLTAARGFIFYLYKTLVPLWLAPYYPRPTSIDFFSLEFAGSVAAFIAISIFCALTFKKRKVFAAAWLFYLVTLLPVIGLVQVGGQAAADRYAYIPGLAPFLLIGCAAAYISARRRALFTAATVIAAATLAVLSINQISIWKDPVTFWSHEISLYPGSVPIAYINRAMAYEDSGRLALALADYTTAMELNRNYPGNYNNRGGLLNTMGRYEEARADLTRAIELNPRFAEAYFNRGLANRHLGMYAEAIADFSAATEINPRLAIAFYSLASVYSIVGEMELAEKAGRRAAELGMR